MLVTATAKGPNHFNSSITVDLAAGGSATVTSPSLGNTMTKATVEFDAPLSDNAPLFKKLAFEMFTQPTPGQRLVHCIMLTAKVLVYDDEQATTLAQTQAQAPDKALQVIYFCLRMAQLITAYLDVPSRPASPRRRAACGHVQVKTKTEQVNGQYVLSPAGPVP